MTESDKSCNKKDLEQGQEVAYKPAYKQKPKTDQNEAQNLTPELAEIVAVWPDLPENIKAAIIALIQTHRTE